MEQVLAQVAPGTAYISFWKLITAVLLFAMWARFAAWVDKDTLAVNTFRILWNLIALIGGAIATCLLLFIPNFWGAIAGFVVVFGGVLIAYVVHRNGLVTDESRVFTPSHISRVISDLFSGKKSSRKQKVDVRERVRLTGPGKRVIGVPEDEVEREQYRLVQDLLFEALLRRAAFVEVIPSGETSRTVFVIDGVATERPPLTRAEADGVISFLKKGIGLNVEERRKPQSGSLTASIGESRYDLLVRTDGSTAGEKLNIRVIGNERYFKADDLGLTPQQIESLRAIMDEKQGMVLVSAPPSQGLTTTLYGLTRTHDAFLYNIQMLETGFKELEIENITQLVFQPGENRTFLADLQKLIRSDPDIVIVPEIRDAASAKVAAQAAVDKQLVYAGVPGVDVFDALRKWIALVGDAAVVAKGLRAVLNQRLVRVLCRECKQPYKPDPAMLRKLNLAPDKVLYRKPEVQFDKQGNPIECPNCHGIGYTGRVGVYSLLIVDDALRDIIRKGAGAAELQAYAVGKSGLSLQQQALQKVFDGTTSIEEVVGATRGGKSRSEGAQRSGPSSPVSATKGSA